MSASGQKSAKRVADILRTHSIDAIYSSPYRRAIETVAPLAEQLHFTIHRDIRLAERHCNDEPVTDFPQVVTYLWNNPLTALPGGESNVIAQNRGMEFLQSLFLKAVEHPGCPNHYVVSTHGQIMALMLQHFYPCVDYVFWSRLSFPDIYRVSISDTKVSSPEHTEKHFEVTPENFRYPVRLWSE